ncbi:cupin domain-containing protein [Nocardioides sp. GXZ039]|uniref:cupin domain-containing protein n=1 Tax=Nocardioides sp. GXZ039 TaxID=3136018 RepID=UPI0030F3E4D8
MTLNPVDHLVVPNAAAEHHSITKVEDTPLLTPAQVRVLAEGSEMILLEVHMPAGQCSPPHVHDHESVGYLVSGGAETVIGGERFVLGPGDGFRHPPGVEHSMTALEQGAVWLEVKSPPARTW